MEHFNLWPPRPGTVGRAPIVIGHAGRWAIVTGVGRARMRLHAPPELLPFREVGRVIARLGTVSGVSRIRRNHALEHAAISVVTERHPTVFLRGRSNRRGFYIYGPIATDELRSAIDEALRRLNAGERSLAIHPRCGTNLAVAGILSGVAATLASSAGTRRNRLPFAILASIGALVVAPDVGDAVQRHATTRADLAGLRVLGVERRRLPFLRDAVHWVTTTSS